MWEAMHHYIFDLYGTLVDIHTDEDSPELWKQMAEYFGTHGAAYEPEELRNAYWQEVREQEHLLRRELPAEIRYPEISLDRVFRELYRRKRRKAESEPADDREPITESERAANRESITESEQTADREPITESERAANRESITESERTADREPITESERAADTEVSGEEALAAETGHVFRKLSTEYIRLYPGVMELLRQLRRRGSVWLLSNAQVIFTGPELDELGLRPMFDGIFISSECRCRKPDTAFFRRLLEEQKIDPAHAVMIGNDGTSDILGAKKAGLHTIYIRSNISPKEPMPDADLCLPEMDLPGLTRILTGE